jgi:hypothetical protein
MIVAIFNAIAAIPALLNALKSLIQFISDQVNAAENRKIIADLAKASQVSKQTKDTSGIENVFDPGKKK